MSGHADTIHPADTIRRIVSDCGWVRGYEKAEVFAALDALEADLVTQADRIAWLEGEVAGWRIKLAECETENQQLRAALDVPPAPARSDDWFERFGYRGDPPPLP